MTMQSERYSPELRRPERRHTVEETHERLLPYVRRTPVGYYETLGPRHELFAKYETEQVAGTFKARGAMAALLDARDRGERIVRTASAGNHAAGVAYAARTLGMQATVYVPETISDNRLRTVVGLGGDHVDVRLGGPSFTDALAACQDELSAGEFVPPFDDLAVIYGQATTAYELLCQKPETSVIFVPVGGGGLLAGTLLAIDAYERAESSGDRLPRKVVGVQIEGRDSMQSSVRSGGLQSASDDTGLCEGAAVDMVGVHPFTIVNDHRNRVEFVTVSAEDVGWAVEQECRVREDHALAMGDAAWSAFPETTALLSVAGARKAHKEPGNVLPDGVWTAMLTGSNVNESLLNEAHQAWSEGRAKDFGRQSLRIAHGAQMVHPRQ